MQGSDAKPAAKFQIQKSGVEGRVGFERTTPGLKVRLPFGPHSAVFAESAGRVRSRSARTNPAVLPAWHLTTGLYEVVGRATRGSS